MLRHEIKIIKNCDVKRINQKDKVISIDTEDNGNFSADNIVFAGDPEFCYRELLSEKSVTKLFKPKKPIQWDFTCFTLPKLNLITSPTIRYGWEKIPIAMHDIFENKKLDDDFSLYLHRPTATDSSFAPEGHTHSMCCPFKFTRMLSGR